MLIVLIIANLALTVGLMTMVKETKKINKEIEDIGFNIAHIQRNVTELGDSSTYTNKPYSQEDYEDAKVKGLDLDNWNDYVSYYGLGEKEDYS